MSRHLDPFYSAKLPFKRMGDQVADLGRRCAAFIENGNFPHIAHGDAETGEIVMKVRIVSDLPDDIEDDAVKTLTAIRGALDKAVHGAATILGSRSLKHAPFPFAENETGFKGQLRSAANGRGPWRGIPDELHTHLLELQPYPEGEGYAGGNNLLAFLGSHANPAKHENVLMVNLQLNGIGITRASGSFHFPRIRSIWNDAKDECEIFRLLPTSGQLEFEIPKLVAFNDAGAYSSVGFTSVLSDLASMAEGIVLGIEAKTAEALQARQD